MNIKNKNQKYYVVLKGKKPGIYLTWQEAQKQVIGFKGAIYKSFTNENEANKYFSSLKNMNEEIFSNEEIDLNIQDDFRNNIHSIFVDGSFNKVKNKIGYGIVFFIDKKKYETFFNSLSKNEVIEFSSSLNVAGEICGILKSLEIAKEKNIANVKFYFDYEGIEKWANKAWQAKTNISIHYVNEIEKYRKNGMNILFQKVRAHANIKYNEIADQLAKKAAF